MKGSTWHPVNAVTVELAIGAHVQRGLRYLVHV